MSDVPPPASRPAASRVGSWLREPLLHFLIAAGLLTAGYHFFGRPEVKVSAQQLTNIRKDYEAALGRPVTQEEFHKMLDDYLENEVLYHEAIRNGLLQDNRVRGLLIQTMRTSLRPIVPAPTEQELIDFRNQTPEIYRYPDKISFEHVSFATGTAVPDGLLEKLRAGATPQGLGDPTIRLANPLAPTFKPQLEHLFGPDFTTELMKAPLNEWAGPYTSSRGVHFIRITSRDPEHDMPMSELRATLAGKWTGVKEAEIISQRVKELMKSYHVVTPGIPADKP